MKKIVIVAVLSLAILATGCPLKEKYIALRTEYIERRETIRAMCTAGTISTTTCDVLRRYDADLTAGDSVARKADSTRAEIKAAWGELEEVIDYQKKSLVDSGPGG